MGKLDKEQEARMAGMAYALGIAEKKGIDGLRKELQMRGALRVGLLIDNDRLDKAFEILATTLYGNIMTTALSALADSDSKKHMIINPCAWYLWISTQNIL